MATDKPQNIDYIPMAEFDKSRFFLTDLLFFCKYHVNLQLRRIDINNN